MLFHTQIVGRKRWRFISPLEMEKVLKPYAKPEAIVNLDMSYQRYTENAWSSSDPAYGDTSAAIQKCTAAHAYTMDTHSSA